VLNAHVADTADSIPLETSAEFTRQAIAEVDSIPAIMAEGAVG